MEVVSIAEILCLYNEGQMIFTSYVKSVLNF